MWEKDAQELYRFISGLLFDSGYYLFIESEPPKTRGGFIPCFQLGIRGFKKGNNSLESLNLLCQAGVVIDDQSLYIKRAAYNGASFFMTIR